jgi:hypothetical protein
MMGGDRRKTAVLEKVESSLLSVLMVASSCAEGAVTPVILLRYLPGTFEICGVLVHMQCKFHFVVSLTKYKDTSVCVNNN